MTLLQEALAPRSDQLNADDLIAGPRTIKITGATIIEGDKGKVISIRFEGDNGKPWKTCKTMGRAMVMVWGIVDDTDPAKIEAQFIGKSLTIYRDSEVDFGAEKGIGGIRISHMSHITSAKTVKLTASRGKKKTFVFEPLIAEVAPIRTAKQTAVQWAEEQIGAAKVCANLDSLASVMARGAKPMGKLEEQNPELWADVNAAYAEARAALDTDPGDGFADEGGE